MAISRQHEPGYPTNEEYTALKEATRSRMIDVVSFINSIFDPARPELATIKNCHSHLKLPQTAELIDTWYKIAKIYENGLVIGTPFLTSAEYLHPSVSYMPVWQTWHSDGKNMGCTEITYYYNHSTDTVTDIKLLMSIFTSFPDIASLLLNFTFFKNQPSSLESLHHQEHTLHGVLPGQSQIIEYDLNTKVLTLKSTPIHGFLKTTDGDIDLYYPVNLTTQLTGQNTPVVYMSAPIYRGY